MQNIRKFGVFALLIAGGIYAAVRLTAPGGTYGGTWKMTLLLPDTEKTICLLRISGDEAHPSVEVTDAPDFATAEAEGARIEDGALRFRIKTERTTLHAVVQPAKEGSTPGRLLGSLRDQANYEKLRLEKTDLRELDPKKTTVPAPGISELKNALEMQTPPQKMIDRLQELLKKHADEPIAQIVLLVLVQLQAHSDAPAADLKSSVDRFLTLASAYGREIEMQSASRLARVLAEITGRNESELAVD